MTRMGRRIGRVAVVIGGLIGILLGAGFASERLARLGDADRYPPPGELVAVAGGRLHLLCSGSGRPTVVLEAGGGESALGWAVVQRELAAETRVCAYDRAGLGWSEPMPGTLTAARAAAALHELLAAADEAGPYVLVGHSLGSFVVRRFVADYPDEVAGLVLLDPTDEEAVLAAGDPGAPIVEARLQGLLAEVGVVRLFGRALVTDAVGDPPPAEVLDAVPLLYGAANRATTVRELEASVESARQVSDATQAQAWGALPAVVISAATSTSSERAQHARLAGLSDRGDHLVATAGGHYVHYADPALVVAAVRQVIGAAAGG